MATPNESLAAGASNDSYDGREKRFAQYLIGVGEKNVAKLVELPQSEPAHRWAWWNPASGQLEINDAQAGPIGYRADSLEALRDMLLDIGTDKSRVFVHRGGVTAVLDGSAGSDRRDRITLAMEDTAAFSKIEELAKRAVNQVTLIAALRMELAGCQVGTPSLLTLVRSMKFDSSSEAESTIGTGSASVSMAARRKALMAGGEPPEHVEFQICVYEPLADEPSYHDVVKCAVDVDVDKKAITVAALPGQIEKLLRTTHLAIAEWLRNGLGESGIKVWCGTPG